MFFFRIATKTNVLGTMVYVFFWFFPLLLYITLAGKCTLSIERRIWPLWPIYMAISLLRCGHQLWGRGYFSLAVHLNVNYKCDTESQNWKKLTLHLQAASEAKVRNSNRKASFRYSVAECTRSSYLTLRLLFALHSGNILRSGRRGIESRDPFIHSTSLWRHSTWYYVITWRHRAS